MSATAGATRALRSRKRDVSSTWRWPAPELSQGADQCATAERIVADYDWLSGRDAHARMARALADNDLALTMPQIDSVSGSSERAFTIYSDAEFLVDEGRDAKARIAEAREAIKKAIAIDKSDYDRHQTLARSSSWRRDHKCTRARRSPPQIASSPRRGGLTRRSPACATPPPIAHWKAAWQAGAGHDPSNVIDEGIRAIDEGLRARPGDAQFEALRGALLWERARAGEKRTA